jgi:hypothetical protein
MLLGLVTLALFSACQPPAPKTQEPEWVDLFNGKDLTGWTPKISGYPLGENVLNVFKVENGVLRVDYSEFGGKFDGRFGHLYYNEPFSHYILQLEYRFVGEMLPDAPTWCYRNSGVMVHSQSAESMGFDQDFPVSLEAQFLSTNDSVQQTTANLCTPGTHVVVNGKYTEEHCLSSSSKFYRDSVWVKAEVVVRGGEMIYHLIEGDTVFAYSKPTIGGDHLPENYPVPVGTALTSGYIALQAEAQELEFRNMRIKVLKP